MFEIESRRITAPFAVVFACGSLPVPIVPDDSLLASADQLIAFVYAASAAVWAAYARALADIAESYAVLTELATATTVLLVLEVLSIIITAPRVDVFAAAINAPANKPVDILVALA